MVLSMLVHDDGSARLPGGPRLVIGSSAELRLPGRHRYTPAVTREPAPWSELSRGPRKALVELLVHGATSRADLARTSGSSAATLTRITRALFEAGLIIENAASPPVRAGRPSLPMDVDVHAAHLIGVNLTRTAIHLVRTDLRARIIEQVDVELASIGPADVARSIADAVNAQQDKDPLVAAVGIGLAGPVAPGSEVVHTSPFLGWREVPLVCMVRELTDLPTVVENDVRALTAAEHWFGAGAGCGNFVLLTIGAGVGCGTVIRHQLVEGRTGGSGQVGHLPLDPAGPRCERGHHGCARSYLASSSIIGQVEAGTRCESLSYRNVLDMAADKNLVAHRVVTDAARALGRLIAAVVSISGPEKVLLSGEGVELAEQNLDLVTTESLAGQHWTLPPVPIEISPFTFTEWARGAAVIALRRQLEATPPLSN